MTGPPIFKYLPAEHALSLINKGEMLLQPLSKFRDIEDNEVRGDQYEGTLVYKPQDGLIINNLSTGKSTITPYAFESRVQVNDIFVYCMSTKLSPELAKEFGTNVCVEILDFPKLLGRMRKALALRPRFKIKHLKYGIVDYYEHQHSQGRDWALPEMIAFKKPLRFIRQEEFRIAVPLRQAFEFENVKLQLAMPGMARFTQSAKQKNLLLRMGSLSSICKLHYFS